VASDKELLLQELKQLNAEVDAVLAKRKAWMDEHMKDFAKVQIGEDIYDLHTKRKLGVVTAHYRYWDHQHNPLYDNGMNVECQFQPNPREKFFDNTSRQPGLWWGPKPKDN
jgi:hypothetical protein